MPARALVLLALLTACDATTGSDAGPGADSPTADAPARDAPELDAPSAEDAPTDAGPLLAGCAGRDYLFCEDFESATVGALPAGWTVGFGWQDESTMPGVSADFAHGGAHSLASAVAIDGQRRAEHDLAALGDARGTHWGRVFYLVRSPAFEPTTGVVHNTMVALLNDSDEARVVDTVIGSWADHPHQFLYNVPDDSCCDGSSYDYDTYDGAWHCAEWRVDAATQSYQFFIDGTEVADIGFSHGAGDTRAHMTAFRAIALGWRNYQTPDVPYESYFDDVAIDDTRIGCD